MIFIFPVVSEHLFVTLILDRFDPVERRSPYELRFLFELLDPITGSVCTRTAETGLSCYFDSLSSSIVIVCTCLWLESADFWLYRSEASLYAAKLSKISLMRASITQS